MGTLGAGDADQLLALVDAGRDCHLVALTVAAGGGAGGRAPPAPFKLASGVTSAVWNDQCSMLALIKVR